MSKLRWYNRPSSWAMAILIAFLALVLGLASCLGATIPASGLTVEEVRTAIGDAVAGDTVTLPAGDEYWYDTVTIDRAISVIGAGKNSTIIRGAGGAPEAFSITVSGTDEVRLSGIGFFAPLRESGHDLVVVAGRVGTSGTIVRSARIDNCAFRGGARSVTWLGQSYGVTDHCYFTNCHTAIYIQANNRASFEYPGGFGSTNSVCMEDNVFVIDGALEGSALDLGTQIYHQEGARTMVRSNLFMGFDFSDIAFVECHPNQDMIAGDPPHPAMWGQQYLEVYGNTLTLDVDNYRWGWLRAGSCLVYSNAFVCSNGTPGSVAFLIPMSEEDAPYAASYGVWDTVSNTFFYGNTKNGSATSADDFAIYNETSAPYIKLHEQYWLEAPNTTNGTPAGIYTTVQPLQYPHPLVSDLPVTNIVATIGISPSSKWYGYRATDTTTDYVFTITNAGNGGTVTGGVSVASPFSIVGTNGFEVTTGQTATVTIRFAPTSAGSWTNNATFTGGGGRQLALSGVAYTIQPDLTWNATEGTVLSPFYTTNTTRIVQSVETTGGTLPIADGGLAVYGFSIETPGDYYVTTDAYAPDDGANSFFIDIDTVPSSASQACGIATSNALQTASVVWWFESTPKVWPLTAGNHVMYVRGREALMQLASFTVTSDEPATPNLLLVPQAHSLRAGQSLYFTNLSSGYDEYGVIFDVGGGDQEEWITNQPGLCVFTYTNVGTYTVSQYGTVGLVTDWRYYGYLITVTNLPPTIQLSVSTNMGFAPLQVWFTNTPARATLTTIAFGDGNSDSGDTNLFVHVYASPGDYDVTVGTFNSWGSSNRVFTDMIHAKAIYAPARLGLKTWYQMTNSP